MLLHLLVLTPFSGRPNNSLVHRIYNPGHSRSQIKLWYLLEDDISIRWCSLFVYLDRKKPQWGVAN